MDDEDFDACPQSRILPTPMALRDISNKAQLSLASLYQTSPDEGLDAVLQNSLTQKKLFDDEDVSAEENDWNVIKMFPNYSFQFKTAFWTL